MKIIAELILSDDRIATIRQILAIDWMTMIASGKDSNLALILTLTEIDGEELTQEEVEYLPLEDFFVIANTIQREFKRITEFAPIFKD